MTKRKPSRRARKRDEPPSRPDVAARRAWEDLIRAYAHWTGRSLVLSLTFARPVSFERARAAVRLLLRTLASDLVKGHFHYAFVIDEQPESGRWHVHALVEGEPMERPTLWGGADALAPHEVLRMWASLNRRFGASTQDRVPEAAQLYLPIEGRGLGGVGPDNWIRYLCEHENLEWGVACPRTGSCAHRRCVVAPDGATVANPLPHA
jgi:hypothetical protein